MLVPSKILEYILCSLGTVSKTKQNKSSWNFPLSWMGGSLMTQFSILKKCLPWEGTMQCRCSCQNSSSIHNYVVPLLCVHMYCTTVHTDCDCTVVSLTDQSIASIQGTPHAHLTDRVKCCAWVPRLEILHW